MNISKNFDWCLQVQEHVIFRQHFGGLINQEFDGLLVEFHWLAPLLLLHLNQLINDKIQCILLFNISRWVRKIFLFLKLVFNF